MEIGKVYHIFELLVAEDENRSFSTVSVHVASPLRAGGETARPTSIKFDRYRTIPDSSSALQENVPDPFVA